MWQQFSPDYFLTSWQCLELFKVFFSKISFRLLLQSALCKSNDFIVKPSKVKFINIEQLIFNLIESDKKLIPKLTYSEEGKVIYKYKKNLYEKELSLKQIEKRIKMKMSVLI